MHIVRAKWLDLMITNWSWYAFRRFVLLEPRTHTHTHRNARNIVDNERMSRRMFVKLLARLVVWLHTTKSVVAFILIVDSTAYSGPATNLRILHHECAAAMQLITIFP